MSIEDTSIYGSGNPESTPIEPCTKSITEEGDKKLFGVSLDTNLILIILAIIVIIFFWSWSDG